MGFLIDTNLWIAVEQGKLSVTLLTANAKDFEDIPNLKFVVVKIPGGESVRVRTLSP